MDRFILNPNIPFIGSLGVKGSFSPNKLIRIQGTIPEVKFNINLQCGLGKFLQDIALQISVNISSRYISLNSTRHQEWNKEILKPLDSILSIPGEKFEMVILCHCNHFKIIIDGQQFCEFPHRIPYCSISHLSILGDVSITRISFEAESGQEFQQLSHSLLSSPVNEVEQKPLLLPDNIDSNSSLPPSYETTIKNNSENVKLQPVQPTHVERPIQFVRINATLRPVISTYSKFRLAISAVAAIFIVIMLIVKSSSGTASTPFRIRRIG